MIQLVEVGQSYKVHGVKGELKLSLDADWRDEILDQGVVFFEVDGNAIPFFIESAKGEEELLVKFKDVNSPEEARLLSHKSIFIDRNRMKEVPSSSSELSSDRLQSYALVDLQSGIRAQIEALEEFPSQLMALVRHGDKEVMIPVREDWIERLDEKEKVLYMNLPAGLFEL